MSKPDRETINRRIAEGWSEEDARNTPIGKHSGRNGKLNIAAQARAAHVSASYVQRMMRDGQSLEMAILTAKKNGYTDKPQHP